MARSDGPTETPAASAPAQPGRAGWSALGEQQQRGTNLPQDVDAWAAMRRR
jgi:hypothetical protein